jgi:hypothetical protein
MGHNEKMYFLYVIFGVLNKLNEKYVFDKIIKNIKMVGLKIYNAICIYIWSCK